MSQLRRLGPRGFGTDLVSQLRDAERQLESDDSWGDRLTDAMAEVLAQIEEDYELQGQADEAFRQLEFLYSHGRIAQDLEIEWKTRLASFSHEELQSSLWVDLVRAVKHAQIGNTEVVRTWLSKTEQRILATMDQYEHLSITSSEITTETVLAHKFLNTGVESWLEALALLDAALDEPDSCAQAVLDCAREGQRYLLAVSLLNRQIASKENFLRLARN